MATGSSTIRSLSQLLSPSVYESPVNDVNDVSTMSPRWINLWRPTKDDLQSLTVRVLKEELY